ncbi:MAG: zf-TFIIB domain-containing protein [Chitinispirillaceae bacterium]|nr:zf-TFIIB domain-containing protein [Chitinispirillaceae bacterium]
MPFCKSCSAPLPPYAAQCEYCGVNNDVNLRGIHDYTVTRPVTERPCPLCKIPLETIDIQSDGHFYIERCPSCMGLFFDPGELNALLDKSVYHVYRIDQKKLWHMTLTENRSPARSRAYITCPVCGGLMNRVNFGARSGVVVDQCKDGIWLDNGALRRLLEWRKAGGQLLHEKIMSERKRREAKERERKQSGRFSGNTAGCFPYSSSINYNNGEITLTPLATAAAKAIWRLFA